MDSNLPPLAFILPEAVIAPLEIVPILTKSLELLTIKVEPTL